MKDHSDIQALLSTLREVLKSKGYTYRKLAEELNISEATVKRIFSKGCTLERIAQICTHLGTSFLEVAALAKTEEEVDYFLSKEQERFFSKYPALFGVFKQLHLGHPFTKVAKDFKLDPQKFFLLLRKLEDQNLLEVLPENGVRLKVKGNIRYTHRGPLAQAILRPQIIQFLDHVDRVLENEQVCMHSAEVEISETHLNEFVEEIHQLGAKYRARAYRDQNLLHVEKRTSVRWLLALAPYKTDWRQYPL